MEGQTAEQTAIRVTSTPIRLKLDGVLAEVDDQRWLVLRDSPAFQQVIESITRVLGRPPTEIWIGELSA